MLKYELQEMKNKYKNKAKLEKTENKINVH